MKKDARQKWCLIYSWQLRKRHHFWRASLFSFGPSYFVKALVTSNQSGRFYKNFVAISEYLNFNAVFVSYFFQFLLLYFELLNFILKKHSKFFDTSTFVKFNCFFKIKNIGSLFFNFIITYLHTFLLQFMLDLTEIILKTEWLLIKSKVGLISKSFSL